MDGGAAGRKRKSRFSDAVGHDAQEPPAKRLDMQSASVAAASAAAIAAAKPAIDPVALAKAAAAKIAAAKLALAVPGRAAAPTAIPTNATASVDPAEQFRISQEKKLRTDQIYKSVQEQMSHIKSLLRKPGDAAAGAGTFIPAPLLLDDQGRQIDANGNVIEQVVAPKTTLIANSKAAASTSRATKNVNPYLSHRSVDKEDKLDAVDPRLKTTKRETYVASADVASSVLIGFMALTPLSLLCVSNNCRRAAKSFSFVTQGTYVKQAEQVRARDAKKMMAGFTSGRNPRAYQKESIVPIDEETESAAAAADGEKPDDSAAVPMDGILDVIVPLKPQSLTPDVEWWDVEYLPKDARQAMDKFGFIKPKSRKENPELIVEYSAMKHKYCGTAHVIEHPARVSLIVKKDDQPVALTLMLTAAVRHALSAAPHVRGN